MKPCRSVAIMKFQWMLGSKERLKLPINNRDVKTNRICMLTLAWAVVLHLVFGNKITSGFLVVQYIHWCG